MSKELELLIVKIENDEYINLKSITESHKSSTLDFCDSVWESYTLTGSQKTQQATFL